MAVAKVRTIVDISHIPLSEVIHAICKAVGAKSYNYVYESDEFGTCRYEMNDEPSCIVGTVLHLLGVSISDLKSLDCAEGGTDANLGVGISRLTQEGRLICTDEQKDILSNLQFDQDAGITWTVALWRALKSSTVVPSN